MTHTSTDRHEASEGGAARIHGHGHRRLAAATGIAECAVGVIAPAFGGAVDEDSASVEAAGADGGHAATQAEHIHRPEGSTDGAVADLAVAVVAPAFDAAGREQRAHVATPTVQRDHAALQGVDIDGGVAIGQGSIAVAKLAQRVITPTFDAAIAHERTDRRVSCRNVDHTAGQPGDLHRDKASAGGAVAKLAGVISSPTLDAIVVVQGAGESSAAGRD